MNAQATRRGLPAIALWGGVGALAWAAITVLTGGSAAHADEESDPSLLGGVTTLVSETVSSVGDTVTAVTKPVVTQVVKPVVTQVVAPVVTHVVRTRAAGSATRRRTRLRDRHEGPRRGSGDGTGRQGPSPTRRSPSSLP